MGTIALRRHKGPYFIVDAVLLLAEAALRGLAASPVRIDHDWPRLPGVQKEDDEVRNVAEQNI